MLPLALAVWKRGGSAAFTCTEMTEHARTNAGVIEGFLPVRVAIREGEAGWHVQVAQRVAEVTAVATTTVTN
jgi:RNA 3'-terminal phosphate cyclase (ATP)